MTDLVNPRPRRAFGGRPVIALDELAAKRTTVAPAISIEDVEGGKDRTHILERVGR